MAQFVPNMKSHLTAAEVTRRSAARCRGQQAARNLSAHIPHPGEAIRNAGLGISVIPKRTKGVTVYCSLVCIILWQPTAVHSVRQARIIRHTA